MHITPFDIFTSIGSFLGIIAFLMNFLAPISEYNKEKYKKLTQIITSEDLNQYTNEVSQGYLSKISYNKLLHLIYCIKNNTDEVQFKGYAGKKAHKYLTQICDKYYEMMTKLQVPYWDSPDNPNLKDDIRYMINEIYYFNEMKDKNEYSRIEQTMKNDRDFITNKADEIYELYKFVLKELNRLPYECLKFW